MHGLTNLARSRSPSRDKPAAETSSTPKPPPLNAERVVSEDGLTYISPPWLAGVPVVSYMAPRKETPAVVKPPTAPTVPSLIFLNPILPGFNPDPSIVRVGEDFFLTTSFEWFPGLPIYHSKDLINWDLIGHALTKISQRDGMDFERVEQGAGIRGPALRYRDGTFYLSACKVAF
jgi:hypothetical protein